MRIPGDHRVRAAVAIAASSFAIAVVALPATASASTTCDRVAATNGSDSAAGTVDQPLRSAAALVDVLAPGQTGCLRAGTYSSDQEIKLETAGITLTSYPGERATLRGRVWVTDSSNGSTVSDLDLDGRNDRGLPSPTVNGDDVTIARNDITNHHEGICMSLGNTVDWGRAVGTLIEDNKIHDCGTMPATNFDHGIYVNAADDTVIRGNWIYDNADRGIQIYPDSHGTLITGNVIDGNGEGVLFAGSEDTASSDNVVENNVITNSQIRNNIESSWGGPVGNGNVARNNCVGGGAYDGGNGGVLAGSSSEVGFNASANLVEVPDYADPANGDFTIPDSSPCAAILAGASKSEIVGTTAPPVITIDTSKKLVHKMVPVKVRGRAPGASSVTLLVRHEGEWRRLGRDNTSGNGSYKMKIRLHRSGRETVKAVAGGLRDSKPVRLRVKK
jgi:parallel beta-helix repeat protein